MKKIISLILVVTMLFIGSVFAQAEGILGDADGNGRISSNDALVVLQNTVKNRNDGLSNAVADVDGDGKISVADAFMIIRMCVKKIVIFPKQDGHAALSEFMKSKGEKYGDEMFFLNGVYDGQSCSLTFNGKSNSFTVSYTTSGAFGKLEFKKDSGTITSHITMSDSSGQTVCWCQGDADKKTFDKSTVINASLNDHKEGYSQDDYNRLATENAVKCIEVFEKILENSGTGMELYNFGFVSFGEGR